MHLGRTARRGGALALWTAGALALGVGSASASTLSPVGGRDQLQPPGVPDGLGLPRLVSMAEVRESVNASSPHVVISYRGADQGDCSQLVSGGGVLNNTVAPV